MADQAEKQILVSTLFGRDNREPLVEVRLPGPEPRVQLRPAEARALALNILQAAEAAIGDGFVFTFARTRLDCSDAEAAGLMVALRGYRQQHDPEGT